MSQLFNMLSRLVKTFLRRSKSLLISWLQSPSAMILEPKKIKSVTVSIVSPSVCHGVMGQCFWTVVLEKTLGNPLYCKEIQPVHSEGDQPWDFFGRNYAEAETPVLWPPHGKIWLFGKGSDAGRDWGQERREQQRMRWLHGITDLMDMSLGELWVGDGQGGLACCNSLGRKESDTTEWLNWTEGTILKRRDITLPTKVYLVKAIFFPVVMNGCESQTIKEAEHWRINAFELWCWESLGLQGDQSSPS